MAGLTKPDSPLLKYPHGSEPILQGTYEQKEAGLLLSCGPERTYLGITAYHRRKKPADRLSQAICRLFYLCDIRYQSEHQPEQKELSAAFCVQVLPASALYELLRQLRIRLFLLLRHEFPQL